MKHLTEILAALLLLAAPVALAQDGGESTTSTSAQGKREIIRTVPAGQQDTLDLQPGESAVLNPETDVFEVSEGPEVPAPRKHTLADLYLEGGYGWTSAITLCLIAMLFAAWKAPRWVKEFGLLAMVIGFLSMMIGCYAVADFVQALGEPISFSLLCGGLRVAFICPIYGMIVYALSLLLRIALKPRI